MGERIIGIKHRVKRTAEGEARPTLVAVLDDSKIKEFKLETEDYEIAFVLGLRPGDLVAMPLGGSGDYLAYAIARQLEKLGGRIIRLKPKLLKERRGNDDKASDHLLVARLAQTEPGLFQPVTVEDLKLIELRGVFRARQDALKARLACEQRLFQRTIGLTFVSEGLSPESSIEKRFLAEKANDRIYRALVEEEGARDRELQAAVRPLPVWREVFAPIEGVGPRIAAALITEIGNVKNFPTEAALKQFCGVAFTNDGRFPRLRVGEVANWNPEARQALYLLGDQFNYRPNSFWGVKLLAYKARFRKKHPQPIVVRKHFVDLFRAIERFYLANGVTIAPGGFRVVNLDSLYSYFRAGITELGDRADNFVDELNSFGERIDELGEGEGKNVTCYTPGHIHKMALWRMLTKFVEWLFREWSRLAPPTAGLAEETALLK